MRPLLRARAGAPQRASGRARASGATACAAPCRARAGSLRREVTHALTGTPEPGRAHGTVRTFTRKQGARAGGGAVPHHDRAHPLFMPLLKVGSTWSWTDEAGQLKS